MKKEYISRGSLQTKRLGEKIAKEILKQKVKKQAFVVGLTGELGGGKTTFLQGFARGLVIKEKILSPTFIIYKKFQISNFKFQNFYHVDCYRIKKQKEILDLGFKEIISNPQNIVAIEWAEKIKKILPKNTLWIDFEFINQKSRKLIVREQFSD